MELKSFTVNNFRSIIDSTTIEVESDVTCLMGKNESGKSALLEALYLLNPIHENDEFEPHRHIPWDKADLYHPDSDSLKKLAPISAVFRLTDDEMSFVRQKYGEGAISEPEITVKRTYDNRMLVDYACNKKSIIDHVISLLPRQLDHCIMNITDSESLYNQTRSAFSDTIIKLKELIDENDRTYEFDPSDLSEAETVIDKFLQGTESIEKSLYEDIRDFIPQFVRFTDYHLLAGRVPFDEILSPSGNYVPKERVNTIRSLLRFSPVQHNEDDQPTVDKILEMSHDDRRKFLDATAHHINKELETRWTQASRKVKIQAETLKDKDYIPLYVENEADGKDFIDEESAGFKWFLSFMVTFSDQIVTNRNTVLLLDEPGLGLHGRQQEQLLRFIIEKNHPVIYTTHSFALVEEISPDKIRLVEQAKVQIGTKVYSWSEREHTDKDTSFPMVVALGYKISSKMYWGGDILLVEGYSDYHYLTAMDSICSGGDADSGLPSDLIVRFSSGKDNIRNLVALIGPDAPVVAVIDSDTEEVEKLKKAARKGNLKNLDVIEVGGDILNCRPGCIEDLFESEDYIAMCNAMCKITGRNDVLTVKSIKDSKASVVNIVIEALQIPANEKGAFKVKVASTLAREEIKLHEN